MELLYMERLYEALLRIANAMEEQNRQNAEWIAMQTKWHGEDNTGERLIAIHEENARMQKEWVESQRRMVIDHFEREHEAYCKIVRDEVVRKLDTEVLVPVFLPGTSQQTTPTRERGE